MSSASDGNNAGQSSGQAGVADSLDLDGRQAMSDRARPQASAPAGRVAKTQRAAAEGQAAIDPLVADQALATAEQKRDNGTRPSSEPQSTPASVLADAQGLKSIDSRHEVLQALVPGTLSVVAAREAASSDVSALNGFADKVLQSRAAAVMGDTAEQHLAYRTALREVSPQYAGLADRAYAEEQQRSAAKEDRKALEYASRRDDAADSIAGRYATMASAGLTIKDLQGPAQDRLAIKDSRDLLLIEGFPPHPRAGETKALIADSLKSDAYRATFDRETTEWATPGVVRATSFSARAVSVELPEQARASGAMPDATQGGTALRSAEPVAVDINSMRSEGDPADKRRAIPPLEDRFNVKRIGLTEKEYHFRDQAGKVAFTGKFMSISAGSDSPAAIRAMVDRAAERGWETVRLIGSPEFVRQGWIAATAQGLKAVGHTATPGDREAATKERARLQVGHDGPAPQRPGETVGRVQSDYAERVSGDRKAAELSGQRQLAAAIEKALVDGKVSPELRGQVRAMMAAEGANRVARGERFKVPVYDARAPRARAKTVRAGPQRHGDRERSR